MDYHTPIDQCQELQKRYEQLVVDLSKIRDASGVVFVKPPFEQLSRYIMRMERALVNDRDDTYPPSYVNNGASIRRDLF